MFDMKLNRQFIFNAMHSRHHRDQSIALDMHQQFVTVTAAITHHKTGNKFYMINHKNNQLIAHDSELESY